MKVLTVVIPPPRKDKCKSNTDCSNQSKCYYHHNREQIKEGLCMDEVDCSENGKPDCNWKNADGGQECCNGYCCSPEIFNQLKTLPCVHHHGCRTLGYGKFCCPVKENISESSTCCDDYPS